MESLPPAPANTLAARLTLERRNLLHELKELRHELAQARREAASYRRLWTASQQLQAITAAQCQAFLHQRDELRVKFAAAREELLDRVGPYAVKNEP